MPHGNVTRTLVTIPLIISINPLVTFSWMDLQVNSSRGYLCWTIIINVTYERQKKSRQRLWRNV